MLKILKTWAKSALSPPVPATMDTYNLKKQNQKQLTEQKTPNNHKRSNKQNQQTLLTETLNLSWATVIADISEHWLTENLSPGTEGNHYRHTYIHTCNSREKSAFIRKLNTVVPKCELNSQHTLLFYIIAAGSKLPSCNHWKH